MPFLRFTCDRCGLQSERHHNARNCHCGGRLVRGDKRKRLDCLDRLRCDLAAICRAAALYLCSGSPVDRANLVAALNQTAGED